MTRFLLTTYIFLLLLLPCTAALQPKTLPTPLVSGKYENMPLDKIYEQGIGFFINQQNDSASLLLTVVAMHDTTRLDSHTRTLMAKASNTLGIICFNHSNFPAAYTHFLKSIQLNDTPDATGYLSLATIYLHYGDKARAFQYLKNYTNHASLKHHYNEACIGISNILSTNFAQAGISADTIATVVDRFLHLPSDVKKAPAYPLANTLATGWVYGHRGEYLRAVDVLKDGIHKLDTLIMPRTRHALFLVIADQYMCAHKKDSAIAYINAAEKLALDNDYKDLLAKTYSEASDMYLRFNNPQMSDTYRRKMLEINDTLFNPRELGKIHDLNMFHEVNKFERRMEVLAVKDRMRLAIIWIVSIALLIVVGLLLILFIKNRDLKAKNRALFELNISDMRSNESILPSVAEASSDPGETMTPGPGSDVPEKSKFTPDETLAENPENYDNHATEKDHNAKEVSQNKYTGSNISDKTRSRVYERIKEIFKDESIFCKPGFTLNDLALLCESNSRYVSQILNEEMSTNFTQLLNSERVNVARKRLMDTDHYGHLTIEAIIMGLGCKSRSTFSKTFKRITGLTPSEFQRIARDMSTQGDNPSDPR
ncbi:MAG: helix-turn-helix transcriptional regulator [Muribaculaceae bacterium]|nr:helix-turn-helix transcriptional regulator [Muribaculaceae bacterium]